MLQKLRKAFYFEDLTFASTLVSDCGFRFKWFDKLNSSCFLRRRSNLHKVPLCRVPPSVYKKAKQAPEGRRETVMIKELEAILSKEDLTASSSKDGIVLKLQITPKT